MSRDAWVALLRQSVDQFNAYRAEHPNEDVTLVEADLSFASLPRANFERADLRRCRLEGCDLSGARFDEARMDHANLRGARLPGATLWRASLAGGILYGADLRDARLDEAKLARVDLCDADLRGATFRGAGSHRDRSALGEVRAQRARRRRPHRGADSDVDRFTSAQVHRSRIKVHRFTDSRITGSGHLVHLVQPCTCRLVTCDL